MRHLGRRSVLSIAASAAAGCLAPPQENDSVEFEPEFSEGVEEIWRFETGGRVFSSPVLYEDVLYFGSNDGRVYSVDLEGNLVAQYRANDGVGGSPVVEDGVVYFGDRGGDVFAYELGSDEPLWQFGADDAVVGGVVKYNGGIYVTSLDRHVYSVDSSGEVNWSFKTDGGITTSAEAVEGKIYVGTSTRAVGEPLENYVYCLDSAEGDLIWKHQVGNNVSGGPVVDGDWLYVTSRDKHVYSLDKESGELRWKFETRDWVTAAPDFDDDTVYVGGRDTRFYALDKESGEVRWTYDTDPMSMIGGSPRVSGGRVYFGDVSGRMRALDTDDGTPAWWVLTGNAVHTRSVVHDDDVYFGSNDGHLYAVRET